MVSPLFRVPYSLLDNMPLDRAAAPLGKPFDAPVGCVKTLEIVREAWPIPDETTTTVAVRLVFRSRPPPPVFVCLFLFLVFFR